METLFHKKNSYYSPEAFYDEIKLRIKKIKTTSQAFALVTLDFDSFNYVNDLFGYHIGDLVLEKIKDYFTSQLEEHDIFCNVHSDHFAFCFDTSDTQLIAKKLLSLTDLTTALEKVLPSHYHLVASSGIIIIKNDSIPLPALLDKANYARKKSKGSTMNTFLFYDDEMNQDLQWQKQITLMMDSALKNHEFEMYLQPKILIKTDEIVGAEALVRWNSPQYGTIYPDRFISIMEQNGFITQIDFYMLEEACRFLNESKKAGIPQLPISVNFSKVHLQTHKLVEKIFFTVNSMGISTNLIEIEFTESSFSDNLEKLIEIVSTLKLLGFRVSMDDFGSAYSSLNYLKDLPIDIIKIDKEFLNSSTNTDKGKFIISKVVELIKSLRMISVMEGVETTDDVTFLKKLSCDFGQGYFYSKPVPTKEYVDYLNHGSAIEDIQTYLNDSEGKDSDKSYLYNIPQEFQMDNWELYTLGKNIDMGLMKGYLDGEATVQYVNDRALEYLGYTRQEFREVFNNSIVAFTHPDDAHIIQKNAEQLIASGTPLEFETRAIRKDGKVIVLRGRSSCVIDNHGRPVGIYAFQDVTEAQEKTLHLKNSLESKIKELEAIVVSEQEIKESLRLSEERYRMIVEQSDDIMFEWDFSTDIIVFSDKYQALFGKDPITTHVSDNPLLRQNIHPDDLHYFEDWVVHTYKQKGHFSSQYRIQDITGNYIWMRCRSTAICDKEGIPLKTIGVFSNISAEKLELESLILKSQSDPLTKLLNKEETQRRITKTLTLYPEKSGAFFIIDIDNFKGINDNLGHQMGDTVLVDISYKVQKVFRETDIIGRIGGDEIAVYLSGINEEATYKKAEKLAQILRLSYFSAHSKYEISGSIGISLYPSQATCFDDLYSLADIALYDSKNKGKDCYTIYSKDISGSNRDNRTPVDCSEEFLNSYFENDITYHVFKLLYETKDIEANLQSVLELIGRKYKMDRVYIFEYNDSKTLFSNTYEWCAEGINPEIDNLQDLSLATLKPYFDSYSQEGIYSCYDIRKSISELYDLCEPQGIKSLLHCAIHNRGEMIGMIGFDVCRDYHQWTGEEIAILGYISRILSIFLIKTNTETKLIKNYKNYVEMLDNLNGYVYVIKPDTYELLYINNAVENLGGIFIGQTCYEAAFGVDTPCENCPINQFDENTPYATEEIYSKTLGHWINSAASKMKWEGDQDVVLICCTDISKYKK